MTKYMYFMVNITIFICKARHLVSISCISKHTHTEYYTQIINKCLHFCIISCFFTFGYKTEVELSCCIRYIHILKTVITLHAYNYVYNSGFFPVIYLKCMHRIGLPFTRTQSKFVLLDQYISMLSG